MQDIYIQSKVIDIFPKFQMAAAAILYFQFMWVWPFRHVDSVVFVFCTKFGSNVCYSHWDRCTFFRPSFDVSRESCLKSLITLNNKIILFISISTQTQNIKLCNVGKYNQSKDEKADKQH